MNEKRLTFPSMAKCERCKKVVPFDKTKQYSTFSVDDGQLNFRICEECDRKKGNQNIQEFVWEFRRRRKILKDAGLED